MRRVQKILLGVFLGGILLGGIGTGVAFVEYSSIAYAGEKKIGDENLITKDFDYAFDSSQGIVKVDPAWYDDNQVTQVETDASVPEGVVRCRMTYNTKSITPSLHFSENDEDIAEAGPLHSQGTLYLEKHYHDDFGLWMENKDQILNDLKQGQISSYQVYYITNIKVLVNPASAKFVKIDQ